VVVTAGLTAALLRPAREHVGAERQPCLDAEAA
jgi:hypothetical protein